MSGDEEPIRILYVEDDPDLAAATSEFLELEHEHFDVETAPEAEEAEQRLADEAFDCVVSDYEMPGQNGVEFLRTVRDKQPDLPFILYTGKGSEEVASEAISAGVTDYLQKGPGTGQYTVLANRIANAVEARRSAQKLEESRQRLSAYNRTLRRLYEISTRRELSLDDKIRQLLELGCEYLGFESGFLTTIDRAADRWEVLQSVGSDDRLAPGTTLPLSETYCRIIVESDAVRAITDAPVEAGAEFERWGYRSLIGNTVWVEEEPYGTLCFSDRTGVETSFDDAARTFVELSSHWVGAELERRRRERRLQRHTRYTADLLDAIDDVFYVVDREGNFRRWNETLREVTGYTDDEIAEMPATAFVPDDDTEAVIEALAEVFETGSSYLEAPVVTKSGETIPYEFIGARVPDPDGEPVTVGIARNLTERKRHQQAVERERDRLDTLFQNLPNPVVRGVVEGDEAYIQNVNPAFEKTFGYEAEAVEGERLHDLVLPDDPSLRKKGKALTRRLLEHGELHTDVRRQTADGPRDFRVDVTLRNPESERPDGYAIYTDITGHKERERRRERRYEAIFDHTFQYTGLLKPDGTLLEANRAALESAGLTEDEVIGQPFWETFWWQNDEETQRRVREAVERAADGEFVRFQTEQRETEGLRAVDFSIRPVRDEEGEILYLLPEGRNISELKALEERERALQRQNERLDEFASLLSHDLRNPLNAAVTHLSLARQKCEIEELEAVARSHERMKSLIEDVLTLAREGKTVTSTEPVDLAELCETIGDDMDLEAASLVTATRRVIRADEPRLRRLLENLIRNAIEHGGADVAITIGDLADGFFVEDDGRGIPEESREEIFEAGYSTSDTGTGFGLSIVRQIAEAHDWTIRVTESEAGGARFEFTDVETV